MQRTFFLLLVTVILACGLYLFFKLPIQKAVVFYYRNTDKIVAYLPVDTGDTFQIIFTHSIHLTDVVEKYRVTGDNEIVQYEFIFEQFGIGMPNNAREGEIFTYEDGKYHIKNMNNRFPYIKIRNGKTVSRHRLVWGEEGENQVWFNDYFIPGEYYTIKVEDLTMWQALKGVKIDVRQDG